MALLAGTVMDAAAALMNDNAKQQFTYPAQVPYLNIALNNLQEIFEQYEIPVVSTVSAILTIPAATDHISFVGTFPTLPTDLIDPSIIWESPTGQSKFVPMRRVDFLDQSLAGQQNQSFVYYTWQAQQIRFFAAVAIIDLKIDYIKSIFATVIDQTTDISVVNAQSYLEFRTAALLARYVAENPNRADSLDMEAIKSLDNVVGIGTKGRQAITTRRRPFRSGYKRGQFI